MRNAKEILVKFKKILIQAGWWIRFCRISQSSPTAKFWPFRS